MSEMIERVARGIHLRRPNSLVTRWEDCADEYRTGTLRDAHAAIEAMREPTTIMIVAAKRTDSGCELELHDIETVWRAMIDEAIKP